MTDDAAAAFDRLEPAQIALLLDFDGTLVDIAPTPDAVHVPDDLRRSLAKLLQKTNGAVALVSGRPIAELDRFLTPLRLPIVGGHGAEMRVREGETIAIAAPLPAAMRARLQQGVEFARGIVAEDKGYSFTLHYRNAPSARERLRAHIDAVCAEFAIEPVEVMSGKAVFEVKRPGVSKGGTVRKLMTHPPFAGRTPIFIGDDETDKTLFAILPDYDGIGFSVDLEYPGLAGVFASPADVRRALAQLAAT